MEKTKEMPGKILNRKEFISHAESPTFLKYILKEIQVVI